MRLIMENKKGITLVALTITIVVMIIIASITAYEGINLLKQSKLQDLVTNMLLIQAKAKEYLEEVNFQTANIPDTNVEEINKIKDENLKGTKITDSGITDVQTAAYNTEAILMEKEDEYYYLNQQILEEMGLKDLNSEEYGYFIIRYDLENFKVEVINTKGYNGNYTLEQLQQLQQGE